MGWKDDEISRRNAFNKKQEDISSEKKAKYDIVCTKINNYWEQFIAANRQLSHDLRLSEITHAGRIWKLQKNGSAYISNSLEALFLVCGAYPYRSCAISFDTVSNRMLGRLYHSSANEGYEEQEAIFSINDHNIDMIIRAICTTYPLFAQIKLINYIDKNNSALWNPIEYSRRKRKLLEYEY